eukprot:gnl/MRDRNA2_/MRDRNA2_15308_c0_seq1.p1 gnl/MRDRNA2_/MRDRNA2_15308_c0~~gnl/MRDRNA2_/MRDRNA2_15308_c0_seq1.p1  ORF type:complete len:166 (+),score=29.58 gnl/MRDRNA2_/MRDRNA2_15308_c0_seq1:200-697(+)
MGVPKLSCGRLKQWICEKSQAAPPCAFMVVDVRGRDHIGGHIPGSLHMPSTSIVCKQAWCQELARVVVEFHQMARVDACIVVFHCMYSEIRGPERAELFQTFLRSQDLEEFQEIQVMLLDGGFHSWLNMYYMSNPEMIEDLDQRWWCIQRENLSGREKLTAGSRS